MTAFTVGKTTINPAREPLSRAVRRLRLEVESEMVARADMADDPDALQTVGLQRVGLARRSGAPVVIETAAAAPPLSPRLAR